MSFSASALTGTPPCVGLLFDYVVRNKTLLVPCSTPPHTGQQRYSGAEERPKRSSAHRVCKTRPPPSKTCGTLSAGSPCVTSAEQLPHLLPCRARNMLSVLFFSFAQPLLLPSRLSLFCRDSCAPPWRFAPALLSARLAGVNFLCPRAAIPPRRGWSLSPPAGPNAPWAPSLFRALLATYPSVCLRTSPLPSMLASPAEVLLFFSRLDGFTAVPPPPRA